MKTILFPTQFSDQAYSRLTSACRLAHKNGARIIVLATIPLPDAYEYPNVASLQHAVEQVQLHYMTAFKKLKAGVEAAFPGRLDIRFESQMGNPALTIMAAAQKYQPNVILMGGKIYGGVNSITEKLIQKVDCPVLALPTDTQLEDSPKLVYATNFRKEDRRIINKLLRFAVDFSGSLHCIHIKQDNSQKDYAKVLPWEQQYKEEIAAGLISFEVIYQEEVHQQLDNAWHKHKPGLWVQPIAQKNWFSKLFPFSSPSLDVSPSGSPVLALNRS